MLTEKDYDMQQKSLKKNVRNAGKNSTNPDFIFQHMSNHYRRILNAKKAVDTSPPYCYKPRRLNTLNATDACAKNNKGKKVLLNRNTSPAVTERSISTNSYKDSCWGTESYIGSRYHASCIQENSTTPVKYTCIDMDLINRITYDTKNGPSAYRDEGWMEVKAQHNVKRYENPLKEKQNKKETQQVLNSKRRFQSKDNESKQKRKFSLQIETENQSEIPISCSLGAPNCKCVNICVCDNSESALGLKKPIENPKESQTSSRDSAYNGGVSSLPESRSPTPDQRGKKECTCLKEDERYFREENEVKTFKTKELSKATTTSENFNDDIQFLKETESDLPIPSKREDEDQKESLRKIKEDALYIKFIQDITVEVLEKCLYTNKALKKVMKRHIIDNLQTLDKERMLKEVENLRIQLGIPEDKSLFDLDVDIDESSTDMLNLCSVISDSEFVVPKDLITSRESKEIVTTKEDDCQKVLRSSKTTVKTTTEQTKSTDGLPKSVSYVMEQKSENEKIVMESDTDEGDDDELISVIQVAKVLRDKKRGRKVAKPLAAVTASQGNSADESDQSSDCSKRSKIKMLKKDSIDVSICNSSSYSSSESEELQKTIIKNPQEIEETEENEQKDKFGVNNFGNLDADRSTIESHTYKKNRSVSFGSNKNVSVSSRIEIKEKITRTKTTLQDEKNNIKNN